VSFAASALRTLMLGLLAGLSLPLAAQTQTPFGGTPIPLPGTFEAENFDNGGEGVAYHDNVAGNAGGQYRTGDSVDIIVSLDSAGGGFVVNNFETGEWLEYTVNIQAAGQYEIALRVASGTSTGAFRVEIDTNNVTGTVTVPPTGDFHTFAWVAKRGVSLPAGQHVLRLVSAAGFQARSGDNTNPTSLSALQNYIVNEVQPGTGRTGASLHTIIKQNSCTGTAPQGDCATQDPYLIQPESEPGDMYISFWRKLDPDFLQKVVETWHVVFEWKTEGAPEDYRVIVRINTYGGTPYWDIAGDADCSPCAPFWRVNNQALPVPVGEWFKFEVFWHRAPNSNDNTGRVWVAVNGTVIADVTNGNTTAGVAVDPALPWNTSMIGVNGNHIDRIFLEQHYSGGSYPQEQWTDDVQIWKKIPVGGVDARPGDPWYDPPYGMHVP